MNRKDSFEYTIDTPDEDDVDVLVEYVQTSAGYAGCGPSFHHPGDPPEPPEFDITKVTRLDNGDVVVLTAEAMQKLEEAVLDKILEAEDDYPEPDYDPYD